MGKFTVPRLGSLVVVGLALTLIWGIVLRSPDTHSNLWTEVKPGYARTDVAMLSGEASWVSSQPRVAFALPNLTTGTGGFRPIDPGRGIYIGQDCSQCHGLNAEGGPVGRSLAGIAPGTVEHMVRTGLGGMPSYSKDKLSDTDLGKLATYLQGLKGAPKANMSELASIANLTYDPSVPGDVLLKGKDIVRQSCGACHTQPTKQQVVSDFTKDSQLASLLVVMAHNANLNIEDAQAVAYYLLALRNDDDPVKEPHYGSHVLLSAQAATATPVAKATPVPTNTPTPQPTPTPLAAIATTPSAGSQPNVTPVATPTATTVPAPPTPNGLVRRGEELFQGASGVGCAGCHGTDASGKIGPNIRGASAQKISHALQTVGMMSFLELSDSDIEAIAAFLASLK